MLHDRHFKAKHSLVRNFWQFFAIFSIAFLIRLIGSSATSALTDELYHLLASQSWLQNGSYAILDGEYARARGYTVLLSAFSYVFNNNELFVARLPSILSGSFLVAALFVWLKDTTERKVAWCAALLLCFADFSIQISLFARFYALQALLVWIASVAIYSIVTKKWEARRSAVLLAVAIVISAFSMHLQVTSAVALIGLFVWTCIDYASQPIGRNLLKKYWAALAILFLAVTIVALFKFGSLIEEFRYAPLWARDTSQTLLYYFWEFGFVMPVLWYLLPLASIVALSRWTRPAMFCIVMLAVPLLIHSFGGMKAFRYVYYALPYFFALWGMAIITLAPKLLNMIESSVDSVETYLSLRLSVRTNRVLALGILVLIFGLGILANSIYTSSFHTIYTNIRSIVAAPSSLLSNPKDGAWPSQKYALEQAIGKPAMFITTDDLRTIRYLGSYDVLLHASILSDVKTWKDFQTDFRTGRPIIASGESVRKLIECSEDGVILVTDQNWGKTRIINNDAADAIKTMTTLDSKIPGFKLFKWSTPVISDACKVFIDSIKITHD